MEKSQDALKTIGEMSKALGVQPHILRYWEEQFSVLNPLKRAGGRRYYRSEDAALLQKIHRLIYTEGFTIKGAQKYLRDTKKLDVKKSDIEKSDGTKLPGLAAASHVPSNSQSDQLFEADGPKNIGAENNGYVDMSDEVRMKLTKIADDLRKALAA